MQPAVKATLAPIRSVTQEVEPRIQALFNAAAIEGERGLSLLRILFCAMAVTREVLFNHALLLAGDPREWLATTVITTGMVLSIPLFRVKTELAWQAIRRRLLLGVLLDVTLVFGGLVALVLFPAEMHVGLMYSPFMLVFPCAIAAAGLRLSRSLVVPSTVGVLAAFGLLAWLDIRRSGDTLAYPLGHVVFVVMTLVLCGVLAFLMTSRARNLVNTAAGTVLEVTRVRERLGAYVSDAVAEHALSSATFTLGGERMDVAVLFSDLRGFTAMSERLDPQQLVRELNAYLEAMVAVIHSHGGVVDKYVGDSIMAVFGAPRGSGADAANALRAAVGMQNALVDHNRWRAQEGLAPLQQGIGIHHGPVVAGNVGTTQHAQYTVVGDTVNLAARLQAATKDHSVGILLSDAVHRAATAQPGERPLPPLKPVGAITVRGREASVETYTTG